MTHRQDQSLQRNPYSRIQRMFAALLTQAQRPQSSLDSRTLAQVAVSLDLEALRKQGDRATHAEAGTPKNDSKAHLQTCLQAGSYTSTAPGVSMRGEGAESCRRRLGKDVLLKPPRLLPTPHLL